jgi:hypothetical protein
LGFLAEYPILRIQYKFMLAKQQQIVDAGTERKKQEAAEANGDKLEHGAALNDSVEHEGGHGHGDDGVTAASTSKEKFEALERKVTNKDHLCFEEDFLSMTIFSYLKSNQQVWDERNGRLGWGIKPEKQA